MTTSASRSSAPGCADRSGSWDVVRFQPRRDAPGGRHDEHLGLGDAVDISRAGDARERDERVVGRKGGVVLGVVGLGGAGDGRGGATRAAGVRDHVEVARAGRLAPDGDRVRRDVDDPRTVVSEGRRGRLARSPLRATMPCRSPSSWIQVKSPVSPTTAMRSPALQCAGE